MTEWSPGKLCPECFQSVVTPPGRGVATDQAMDGAVLDVPPADRVQFSMNKLRRMRQLQEGIAEMMGEVWRELDAVAQQLPIVVEPEE